VRIIEGGFERTTLGLPFLTGLERKSGSDSQDDSEIVFTRPGGAGIPFESWRPNPGRGNQVGVSLVLKAHSSPFDSIVAGVLWYRGGRFEISEERLVKVQENMTVNFNVTVPGRDGWIGVWVRPQGREGTDAIEVVSRVLR
jgi:hypothetical protein